MGFLHPDVPDVHDSGVRLWHLHWLLEIEGFLVSQKSDELDSNRLVCRLPSRR